MLLLGVLFVSCSKDDAPAEEMEKSGSEVEEKDIEVESFIFAGMDEIYLYEAEVPELQDGFFTTAEAKKTYLASHSSPKALYEDLQPSHDNFSFMTEDYVALYKLLNSGVSGTTGMNYGLTRFSNSDDIYALVRYVMPGSSADEQGIKRGDFFTEINGESLNLDNYQRLLGLGSYSVRIAKLDGNTIKQTDKVVDLVKVEVAEDPVLLHKVYEMEGKKIGYLMYTSFTPDFDAKLNEVFADFQNQGVTDLILDLRYNGGGDVETATDLASMITGQLEKKVLIKYQYNEKYQTYFKNYRPEVLVKTFDNEIRTGEAINSLNLTELYVLTTGSSASASELVIHGLKPYINVVQIGTNTTGKYQASTTLYDSPNFGMRDDDGNVHVNPNHNYAIQPLILKYFNSQGESDFDEGLFPNVEVYEDPANMGVLGDPSETLLKAAINHILGIGQEEVSASVKQFQQNMKVIGESDMFKPNYQRMYIDDLPFSEGLDRE